MRDKRAVSVEKGIHVLSFPGPEPLSGYGRLYVGDDFCERLTPDVPELEKVLKFARNNGKRLTLLTAYHTNKGLEKLKPVLEILNSRESAAEVVVNDLGVLRILNRSFTNLAPVLGRLFTLTLVHPHFRNRRVFNPDGEALEFFRSRFRLSKEYFDFLSENRIRRVEFDNIFALPLFAEDFIKRGMAVSFYYPFTSLTTSRRCLFAGKKAVSSKFALLGCKKECLEYKLILRAPALEYEIFVKGNAQFLRCGNHLDIAAICEKWGVDRLVTFSA